MGILKSYHTALHSSRFVQGGRAKMLKRAAEAERWIMDKIRAKLATEVEWRAWLWKNTARRWVGCQQCPLGERRCEGQVVLGAGSLEPLLAVVGGVPGPHEDERGAPWVDERGAVLRRACYQLGINLARDAWITHSVACATPRGRRPEKRERVACERRLRAELGVVEPAVLLLLGPLAMRFLSVGRHADLADLRGLVPRRLWPVGLRSVKAVFLTHHPGILLEERGEEKRRLLGEFAEDLRKVKRVLDLLDSRRAS